MPKRQRSSKMKINQDDIILGEYEVTTLLSSDGVYLWAHARARNEEKPVLLQILLSETPWPKSQISAITDYFDALSGVARRSLHLPAQVLSDGKYPMVAVYSPLTGDILEKFLPSSTGSEADRWHQASEAINILHNRGLIHGGLTPRSFVSVDDIVMLTGFGYAPLAPRLVQEALKGFIAPEAETGQPLTKSSDIYSFAQVVAHWRSEIKTSSWYQQATHVDPTLRFRHMRDVAAGLEQALAAFAAAPPPATEDISTQEDVPVISSGPRIIPKFIIAAASEPSDGGQVQGAGRFPAGDLANLIAVPSPGWKFDVWSADLQSTESPVAFVVDSNKTVIAHFSRLRPTTWTLTANAEPARGGEVIGSGRHPDRARVEVEARPAKGWQFASWQGDLGGKIKRATLLMSGNKTVTAVFQRVADSLFSIEVVPLEGGKVLGEGVHQFGENVVLRAVPSPLWRFSHWSGDVPVEAYRNPIEITANESKSLAAHFERTIWEEVDLVMNINPPQGGSVLGVGPSRSKHQKGRMIRIGAVPTTGWRFAGWTGDTQGFMYDPGSRTDLMVAMHSDRTVTASFTQLEGTDISTRPLGSAFESQPSLALSSDESESQKIISSRSSVPSWARAAQKAPSSESNELEEQPVTTLPNQENGPAAEKRVLGKNKKRMLGDAFQAEPTDT
jgi:serine/threonine protein kinase